MPVSYTLFADITFNANSKEKEMKIALAQLNYTIGDIGGNTAKIIDAVERAKREKVDAVIFAEQAVSGTPAFDLLRKTTFLELCDDALSEIASHCDTVAAIVGLPVLSENGTRSAAAQADGSTSIFSAIWFGWCDATTTCRPAIQGRHESHPSRRASCPRKP